MATWIGLGLLAAAEIQAGSGSPPIRVGLYQNPPKVAWSESGRPEGIFVDLVEAIAKAENRTLEYVPGTWAEGLDRLENGQIDLMPDVAFTPERENLYAFHREPVLSDWFQSYARRGSGIRSLVDLDGKRISVIEGSMKKSAFDKLVAGFDLDTPLRTYPDYAAAFAAVEEGAVDAVIANRFYSAANLRGSVLENTAIIFSPTRLFFAAPRTGDPLLLAAIDRHLARMKSDSSSIYYRSLRR